MQLVDKQQVAIRFSQAKSEYDNNAIAQQCIVQKLMALLATQGKAFGKILEIGCGTGMLSEQLMSHCEFECLVLNDLCRDYEPALSKKLPYSSVHYHFGDAERENFGIGYDLVISASAIQWFENEANFLKKTANILNDDGILLFNTFSPKNLYEIKYLLKTGLTYPTEDEWYKLLADGFEVLVLTMEEIPLYFDCALSVLTHLNKTGVSIIDPSKWSDNRLMQFEQRYRTRFQQDLGVTLTYTPLYVMARKKRKQHAW
ncbi:malonyl-ACP O-methyltransferase BioC [Glaesserella parasuis]|uniref:malonyl-ACP O-methyltransferase BioC n=1 Tax=Glaesserella parasuis TaxID=738 RepID=UPI0024369F46|nr:malonyl-ACP O-methyltransferase BioC [Glaesserella parasuis]MDG6352401.1 malonyl-ACP O-methyltransferase BioC [Glaesserella parasuis]MDG6369114.1 malonyl-ACP O-methyltransferase BioC [Glaesserella parasuis]MDG6792804.1 malonyl-ACP O-methyltransferase BioC [Glaesserella parasuis]MDG6841524.1 malonyl-ACP O-methyltransferase BioC [Glaesserella parasuis]MDG6844050.1 malonyl-ACP O-methyltransferase BioC [Glaesserella parasuis]